MYEEILGDWTLYVPIVSSEMDCKILSWFLVYAKAAAISIDLPYSMISFPIL